MGRLPSDLRFAAYAESNFYKSNPEASSQKVHQSVSNRTAGLSPMTSATHLSGNPSQTKGLSKQGFGMSM
jgi:hypothetical protein